MVPEPRVRRPRRQRGAALILALVVLTVTALVAVQAANDAGRNSRGTGLHRHHQAALTAAEWGLQGAIDALESQRAPPAGTWGGGALIEACAVTASDTSSACATLESVIGDWYESEGPSQGSALASLGVSEGDEAPQARVVVERRYEQPLDFEAAAQGAGIHHYAITALGQGRDPAVRAVLTTSIARIYLF